jgi:hypothetical protein
MKKLFFTFLLFPVLSFIPIQSTAQGFYIRTTDQKVKSFDLVSVESLSFQNNNLLLKKIDGVTESFSLSVINTLYFNSLYTAADENPVTIENEKITVYPNPATSYIRINAIWSQSVTVSVIALDGRTRIQTVLTSDNPVLSVNELERGMYLLRIENQVIKFIKQ